MNDLISNGPVDDALECSSEPWFALLQLRVHATVWERASAGGSISLNASANAFLDMQGILYDDFEPSWFHT